MEFSDDKHRGLLRRTPSPATILTASFALTIIIGTEALMIPAMSAMGNLTFIDALFTATSAVCVTGLVVVDTGAHFSHAGQVTILILLQIGALGIFTFSTFFMQFLWGGTSLRSRLLIQEAMTHFPYRNIARLLRNILFLTLVAEALGAFSLWLSLREELGDIRAIYFSIFHSVSAFCNAGFSLWPNSLENYRGNIPVCLTIMILIVMGGLGFIVITECGAYLQFRRSGFRRLSLHSRIVLASTATLIVGGALLFWILEYRNALASLPLSEQILASLFQSITARTAGFNTVRISGLTSATLFILIALMFIGASPGSTGGGVKTTTFSIYMIMIFSYLRGKEHAEIFGRTIPTRVASKALATIATSFALIVVSTMLVVVTEGRRGNPVAHGYFLDCLFESVSAFGTVGLSMGITPALGAASKLVIVGTMFVGRVGPVALALSLMRRETDQRYRYPEESVMIG